MADPSADSPAGWKGPAATAPPKVSKAVLYSAIAGVLVLVAVLLTVMAREPNVEASAEALVADVLARLPEAAPLSAKQIADAAHGLAEARELDGSETDMAANALRQLQERIAQEVGAAVGEGTLEQAESALLAARGAWPDSGRFAEAGPLARRLRQAREIRDLVAQVRDLIAQARDALSLPGGGDSRRLESLKAVVAELRTALEGVQAPDSPEAREARDGIRRELADSAQSALAVRQPEAAQELLAAADGLARDDPEVAQLQRQATRLAESVSRASEIAELVATGRERLAADQLALPRGNSAISHFEAALALDPGNDEATAGLEAVAERYGVLAGQALDRRDPDRAGTLIEKLAALSPAHERLSGLRDRRDDILAADRQREVAAAAQAETTPAATAPQPSAAPARPPAQQAAPIDEEGRVWAAAAGTCDAKLLRVYIDRYPSGRHVDQAWTELSACQG